VSLAELRDARRRAAETLRDWLVELDARQLAQFQNERRRRMALKVAIEALEAATNESF
jgi:hypothetical protein